MKEAKKIAILQCGDVLEKFQPEFGDYPDMVVNMLSACQVGEGLQYDVFNLQKNQYPQNLNDFYFFVMTGSKSSVYDNDPWIGESIEFVQLLVQRNKKILGICFGHQLIGVALKGKVEKSVKGWGIGVSSNRISHQTPWMVTDKTELNILVSHQDQVTQLPIDAQVLIESDFCPYFMVQWSENVISIQGHPEWHKDYAAALMKERRGVIPGQTIEEGLASLVTETDNAVFSQWVLDFASIK